MKNLEEIRNQFSRIVERSVEQRGFKTCHGRILAYLLISNQPSTQQEIVEGTGYSISAISRTLDELENLGSINKFKKSFDNWCCKKLCVNAESQAVKNADV